MVNIIGLFPRSQDEDYQIKKLEEAGFKNENIQVLTKVNTIRKLLGCEPRQVVAKFAGLGAFFGIAVYGIFALVASWCECYLLHFSIDIAFGIILAGLATGALIGGFLGCIIGLAEYEQDTHRYTQGVIMGEKVFVLRTEENDIEKARTTLHQLGCVGIKMIPKQKEE
jgi:hypothetical protein